MAGATSVAGAVTKPSSAWIAMVASDGAGASWLAIGASAGAVAGCGLRDCGGGAGVIALPECGGGGGAQQKRPVPYYTERVIRVVTQAG